MADINPLKLSSNGEVARAQTGDVIPIEHGGTGATTNQGAVTAILPAQENQAGKVLATDGTDVHWIPAADIGYTGSRGVAGYVGSQGDVGYTGSYGPTGYVGSFGYTGSKGTDSAAVVGETAPVSNYDGQLWFDSSTGRLKMWYVDTDSSQWIDAAVGASTPLATPYDIVATTFGTNTNAEEIFRIRAARAFQIPANFSGSIAVAGVAATASSVYLVKKNGTQVATITWAAAGTTGTFSTQALINVAVGDKLSINAPATADTTLADLDISLLTAIATA